MQFGNTNVRAQPYAPTDYSKKPSGENIFGYGPQRVAGQVAPQTQTQGYNGNMMAGAMTGRTQPWGQQPNTQFPTNPTPPVQYQPMPNGAPPTQTPQQAGYQPMIAQPGLDGAGQDAFIQQQHAAYQQWLVGQQGQQWAGTQPQGAQWFGQPVNPTPAPPQQLATPYGMISDPEYGNQNQRQAATHAPSAGGMGSRPFGY